MSSREVWILILVAGSTLFLVGLILYILVSRRYAYKQPSPEEIRIMRSQNNNEHSAHESIMRKIDKNVDRMMTRFGFLDDRNQDPPRVDTDKKK